MGKKVAFEKEFDSWVNESEDREEKYGNLLQEFDEIYQATEEMEVINDLMGEAIFTVELFRPAAVISGAVLDTVPAEDLKDRAEGMYKDIYIPLDREMYGSMLRNYYEKSEKTYQPGLFETIADKFKGDFAAYAESVYEKSIFGSLDKLNSFLDLYEKKYDKAVKKMKNDPLFQALEQFRTIYSSQVGPQLMVYRRNLDHLYKIWVKARFEMQPEKRFYPDANFTMRLTYGEVEGYEPKDAVWYEYYTTLGGLIEKSKLDKPDYVIPEKLQRLYNEKDYGPYGVNGKMPLCFSASNHTSGGNSGSPVLDANGRLIGINFDRNWHGTMSDEMYDPEMCRNISVDIRYVLFVIDKFAGAGYLLDEMVIVEQALEPVPVEEVL